MVDYELIHIDKLHPLAIQVAVTDAKLVWTSVDTVSENGEALLQKRFLRVV